MRYYHLIRPTAARKQNVGMVMEIIHAGLQVRVLRYHSWCLEGFRGDDLFFAAS
jgi:hypothetical protein